MDARNTLLHEVNLFFDKHCDNLSHVKSELLSFIERITTYLENNVDVELAYTVGYCWYCIDEKTERRNSEAEKWLKQALILNPEHQYARLYLGHLFFDMGNYKRALSYFEKIPKGYFSLKFNQLWRDIKVEELIACCQIYTCDEERFLLSVIKSITQKYSAVKPEYTAVPQEIIQATAWMVKKSRKKEEIIESVVGVIDLIEREQLQHLFVDELKILRYGG